MLLVGHPFIYNTAIVMASPGNPALGRYIADFVLPFIPRHTAEINWSKTSPITGPRAFTGFWRKRQNWERDQVSLVVAPPRVFEPCQLYGSWCNITDETVAVHMFELSYAPSHVRRAYRLYNGFKKTSHLLVFASIVALAVLLLWLLQRSRR